jgi:hypothetical protein
MRLNSLPENNESLTINMLVAKKLSKLTGKVLLENGVRLYMLFKWHCN